MPAKKKLTDKDPQVVEAPKKTLVFLDVAIAVDTDLSHLGRLVFELSTLTHPRTVANFKGLCTGTQLPAPAEGKGGASKIKDPKLYSYLETRFTRVTEDGIQGGAVHSGTVDLKEYDFTPLEGFGSSAAEALSAPVAGGRVASVAPGASSKNAKLDVPNDNNCIFGKEFEDENVGAIPFSYGSLGMCNSGPNTNGSHFFICTSKPHPTDYDETLTRTKHLNTNHVCFGNLVSGKDVLEELQARMEAMVVDDVGFMPAHSYDSPQFVVVGCGSVAAEASE